MKKLKYLLKILYTPNIWIRMGTCSRQWDAVLNSALNTGALERVDKYTCMIGGIEVWIANYPYSYGSKNDGYFHLPFRSTVFRLKEAIDELDRAAFIK